jgi:cytochrome P450
MRLKLHKDPWYYSWLDRNGSSFATTNPDLHKLRAGPIKKSLSTASISRVEHVLKQHYERLMLRLKEYRDAGQPINMTDAYRALASDVVADISFPKNLALLDQPDLGHEFHEFIRNYTMLCIWNRQFPWLGQILDSLPRWLVALQGETALNIVDALEQQKQQARDVIINDGKPISSKAFPVIMNEVYKSPDLPPSEKTPRRLFDEIAILMGAGSETTSHSLLTITYHVLANPTTLKSLQTELRDAFTGEQRRSVLSYKQLENLPYLTAVITEGLRLATAVSGRFPRINKTTPMQYTSPGTPSTSYTIPPGATISMTTRDMHYHPSCFPSPHTFDPERFLGERRKEGLRWFAPFGRGPRACVGQSLAMAEMYMAIGNLFARWDVRLAEGIGERDVVMVHECFSPFVEEGSRGVELDVLGYMGESF